MIAGRYIAIAIVRAYQLVLSPMKGLLFGAFSCCRFFPTCSCYAIESFRVHGLLRGSLLTARRLLRCHPWGGCGDDPVPQLKPACAAHK
ncbi:MAG: membrane protein insertion efficiency factor YidD [Limisphaerales bacterium]